MTLTSTVGEVGFAPSHALSSVEEDQEALHTGGLCTVPMTSFTITLNVLLRRASRTESPGWLGRRPPSILPLLLGIRGAVVY